MTIAAVMVMQARLHGQTPASDGDSADRAIVFELGVAGDWERGESGQTGGTVAFEVTPIEHWLELEAGVTAVTAGDGIETAVDLLFKKPWQPSARFEVMIGAGPELVHAPGPDGGTFWGAEGVLDLMFWPTKRVGWYVEPGYEIVWRQGTPRHGAGMAAGLLIGR
jgi:hypothetical protein